MNDDRHFDVWKLQDTLYVGIGHCRHIAQGVRYDQKAMMHIDDFANWVGKKMFAEIERRWGDEKFAFVRVECSLWLPILPDPDIPF